MSQIMTERVLLDSGELGCALMQEHLIRWPRRIGGQCLKEESPCPPMPNC